MTFLAAHALWGLLLLVVPALLHLVRPRPRTLRTTTLAFFAALHRTTRDAPWLRLLKRLLALLLSLLAVALIVAALARPILAPPSAAAHSVVILVDRSASMAARDGDGRSRLAVALGDARARLAALPAGTAVAVVAHDARADIVCAPTVDHGAALRALSALAVRPVAGDPAARAAALALAGQLAASAVPAQVWDASDQPALPGADRQLPPGVTLIGRSVALSRALNAGITAADLRRRPLEPSQIEVFVQVEAVLPPGTTAAAELTAAIDGTTVTLRALSFSADATGRCPVQRLSIPLDRPVGALLSLDLRLPGDVLDLDDRVELLLPRQERLHVLLVGSSPDPFVSIALAGLAEAGAISVASVAPTAWRADLAADVAIFAGWLPPEWSARPALVIDPPAGRPPFAALAIDGGLAVDSPRLADPGHALLYGVASARVAALQTAVLPSEGPLAPLWSSPAGPFLAAGEIQGARVVALAAAVDRSERLALTSVWPLLIGNALLWCSQPERDRQGGERHRTGTVLTLKGAQLTWSDGTTLRSASHLVELDRLGAWRTEAGETGSAALLDAGETELPLAPPASGDQAATPWWRGDLMPLLLGLLLGLLLLEAWLNHRLGVA